MKKKQFLRIVNTVMPNDLSIPFFKPGLGPREISAINSIMQSGWLTTGPETQAFEQEFAAFLENNTPSGNADGHITAIAVNSGTAGLHLALIALGIGPGDRVAVPTMTFTATAGVVRYTGADPVFIDSCPGNGNIDPDCLHRVRNRIDAVIPVHLAGYPCNLDDIRQAVGKDIPIVEDAAHAFPSRVKDGMVGTLGKIGIYSFYTTKPITTGEGGMIVCRDTDLSKQLRKLRLHGIDRPVWDRYNSRAESENWKYDVVELGYKYNMTDLAAAIGRVQLSRAEEFLTERRRHARWYTEALADLDGLELPQDIQGHAWHLYIIKLYSRECRDNLIYRLHTEGVGTSVHFIPLHRMSYWKKTYSLKPQDLPVAEDMADRILSLPLWPGLKKTEVNRVAAIIREVLSERS